MPASRERPLVGPSLRVGLDRRARLARHDDDGVLEVVLQRGAHVVGVGGVQHDERHAGRGADDLGRERRAAHAAEHDVVEPLPGQLVTQRGDLADERPGAARQADPGQPLGRLVLGLGAPQRRVLREELARDWASTSAGTCGRRSRPPPLRRR